MEPMTQAMQLVRLTSNDVVPSSPCYQLTVDTVSLSTAWLNGAAMHTANFCASAQHAMIRAGTFSAVWLTYHNGLTSCNLDDTPIWVMFAGGLFVCFGVYFLGHRVIKTMGFGLASINYLRGFSIEFASAISVVVATVLGLPVSTTHCQVGAVIFVGWTAFGRRHVKWSMLGWIALTWLVTLPLSGGLAAILLLAGRWTIHS
jgi:solute carrier family 20 (sodium-dependent phosphate transporter)